MPRRRVPVRRKINPDPKFQDRLVAKFINNLMRRGKMSTAEGIAYGAFSIIEERSKEEPLKVFKRALDNVKPVLEVKSRRVGGATYQVPVEVRQDRRVALAMRWIITYGKARGEKTMMEKLAGEIMDASNNRGNAVKKREDTHKMAEANKAFSHYRW
ncbi:MAG: 30S ribosomal protein S7 [Myxococcota bacterium]|jgi:small subunit ribosomal protein S7